MYLEKVSTATKLLGGRRKLIITQEDGGQTAEGTGVHLPSLHAFLETLLRDEIQFSSPCDTCVGTAGWGAALQLWLWFWVCFRVPLLIVCFSSL